MGCEAGFCVLVTKVHLGAHSPAQQPPLHGGRNGTPLAIPVGGELTIDLLLSTLALLNMPIALFHPLAHFYV